MWLNVVAPRMENFGRLPDSRKANDYRSYIHRQADAGTKQKL